MTTSFKIPLTQVRLLLLVRIYLLLGISDFQFSISRSLHYCWYFFLRSVYKFILRILLMIFSHTCSTWCRVKEIFLSPIFYNYFYIENNLCHQNNILIPIFCTIFLCYTWTSSPFLCLIYYPVPHTVKRKHDLRITIYSPSSILCIAYKSLCDIHCEPTHPVSLGPSTAYLYVTWDKLKNFKLYSGGWNQGPLDTAATNGLLCQPRVIMVMEKSVEWLAGENEVLGENLPQCRFVHHKPTCCPYANPSRHGGKPASNRLSYGTAMSREICCDNVKRCVYFEITVPWDQQVYLCKWNLQNIHTYPITTVAAFTNMLYLNTVSNPPNIQSLHIFTYSLSHAFIDMQHKHHAKTPNLHQWYTSLSSVP
jgi:hypothetical protein